MPRQRIIKPDFWADEKIGKLSIGARLMFIGIWNFCDDKGVCRATPAFLRSQIFQHDDIPLKEIEKYINELYLNERIFLADFNDERFLMVANFRKHQKIDRPSDISFIKELSDDKLLDLFNSSSSRRAVSDNSLPNIREAKLREAKLREEEKVISDEMERIINYLNKVCSSSFKSNNKKTISFIQARKKEGFVIDDFIKVIDRKHSEWGNSEKMSKFLRPETLFGSKFENYLNSGKSSAELFNEKYGHLASKEE